MAMKTRADVFSLGDRHRRDDAHPRLEGGGQNATSFPGAVQQGDRRSQRLRPRRSGIHQDGMLKHTQTYEIMTPESVGVTKTSLVMGKHSGGNAFPLEAGRAGYKVSDNELNDAFERFKALADRKKHVYDEDIEALVGRAGWPPPTTASSSSRLSVIAGTRGPQRATGLLEARDLEGRVRHRGGRPATARWTRCSTASPTRSPPTRRRWRPLPRSTAVHRGHRRAKPKCSVTPQLPARPLRHRPRRRPGHAGGPSGEGPTLAALNKLLGARRGAS